jgi:hypothetical protein
MTARRRIRASDELPDMAVEIARLSHVVARQGAQIEALMAREARRDATLAAHAAELVEHGELIRESAASAKDRSASAGTKTLKEATAYAAGYSAEMIRIWLNAGLVEGEMDGGRWHVNVESLKTFVASKRTSAA